MENSVAKEIEGVVKEESVLIICKVINEFIEVEATTSIVIQFLE